MTSTVWIIMAATVTVLISLLAVLRRSRSLGGPLGLPTEWPLTQRAIFSAEERLLHRQLRQALPHHTILAKLPLVRFCQPVDRKVLRQWFDLLSPIHVSFVVCSENGRILAALDVERLDRPTSRRVAVIKQSVFNSCRIRYVRCRADQLPSVAELQLLVPTQGEAARPVVPSKLIDPRTPPPVHTTLAESMRTRRSSMWRDSRYQTDSFFAPDGERAAPPPDYDEEPMPGGMPASSRRMPTPDQANIPGAATADRWTPEPAPRTPSRRSAPVPLRDPDTPRTRY